MAYVYREVFEANGDDSYFQVITKEEFSAARSELVLDGINYDTDLDRSIVPGENGEEMLCLEEVVYLKIFVGGISDV